MQTLFLKITSMINHMEIKSEDDYCRQQGKRVQRIICYNSPLKDRK